jgi:hypothetical protein
MLWHGQVSIDLSRLIFTGNGLAPDALIRVVREEENNGSPIP